MCSANYTAHKKFLLGGYDLLSCYDSKHAKFDSLFFRNKGTGQV